jgi:hypothetical protein
MGLSFFDRVSHRALDMEVMAIAVSFPSLYALGSSSKFPPCRKSNCSLLSGLLSRPHTIHWMSRQAHSPNATQVQHLLYASSFLRIQSGIRVARCLTISMAQETNFTRKARQLPVTIPSTSKTIELRPISRIYKLSSKLWSGLTMLMKSQTAFTVGNPSFPLDLSCHQLALSSSRNQESIVSQA